MGNSKMLRALMSAAALVVAGGLTGCASIVSGTTQVVSVETREASGPLAGASCKLANTKGTYFVNSPGTVTVRRSNGPMNIQCEKDGYGPGVASVHSATKGMLAGNILFGGVIGAGVDIASGAAFEYPPVMSVLMGEPVAATMPMPVTAVPTTYPVAAAPVVAAAPAVAAAPVVAAAPMPVRAPAPAPLRPQDVTPVPQAPMPVRTYAPAPVPAPMPVAQIEKVPFRAGISSVTVENMAKERGCTGGLGAGLMTPQGPVEIYRMSCSNGRTFTARCELRQCRAM